MQQIWAIIVYIVARLAEWRLGRGQHGGVDWFARSGLDFCCMGVTLLGLLIYNVIENTSTGNEFSKAISNQGLQRGWVILMVIVFVIVLWAIAFICDEKQSIISRKKITTGWTRAKKGRHRAVYGAFISAIGLLLFLVPIKYLF